MFLPLVRAEVGLGVLGQPGCLLLASSPTGGQSFFGPKKFRDTTSDQAWFAQTTLPEQ